MKTRNEKRGRFLSLIVALVMLMTIVALPGMALVEAPNDAYAADIAPTSGAINMVEVPAYWRGFVRSDRGAHPFRITPTSTGTADTGNVVSVNNTPAIYNNLNFVGGTAQGTTAGSPQLNNFQVGPQGLTANAAYRESFVMFNLSAAEVTAILAMDNSDADNQVNLAFTPVAFAASAPAPGDYPTEWMAYIVPATVTEDLMNFDGTNYTMPVIIYQDLFERRATGRDFLRFYDYDLPRGGETLVTDIVPANLPTTSGYLMDPNNIRVPDGSVFTPDVAALAARHTMNVTLALQAYLTDLIADNPFEDDGVRVMFSLTRFETGVVANNDIAQSFRLLVPVALEPDIIPAMHIPTGYIHFHQSSARAGYPGGGLAGARRRPGEPDPIFIRFDFSDLVDSLDAIAALSFVLDGNSEPGTPDQTSANAFRLALLAPLPSGSSFDITDPLFAPGLTPTALPWQDYRSYDLAELETRLPIFGTEIVMPAAVGQTVMSYASPDLMSAIEDYFTAFPTADYVIFRLRSGSNTGASDPGSLFRIRGNSPPLSQQMRLVMMVDDSGRVVPAPVLSAGDPADMLNIQVDNTFANDTVRVTFENDNGDIHTDSSLLAGAETTNMNIRLPEIAPNADGSFDVTVDILNVNGTLKSTATDTIVFDPFTVFFETRGGNRIDPLRAFAPGATVPAGDVTDPTKEDCTFDGWYLDLALTIPFEFDVTPITEDTTLYAAWISNRDNSVARVINVTSYELMWEHINQSVQTSDYAFYTFPAQNGLRFRRPNAGLISVDPRADRYSESIIRYDLEAEDIAAIMSVESGVILDLFVHETNAPAGGTHIDVRITPAATVYDLHTRYPQRTYPDGRIMLNSFDRWVSGLEAFRAGATSRDFDLPLAGRFAVSNASVGTRVQVDITEALQEYFYENPGVLAFGLSLSNAWNAHFVGFRGASYSNATDRPRLMIPALQTVFVPDDIGVVITPDGETHVRPANQGQDNFNASNNVLIGRSAAGFMEAIFKFDFTPMQLAEVIAVAEAGDPVNFGIGIYTGNSPLTVSAYLAPRSAMLQLPPTNPHNTQFSSPVTYRLARSWGLLFNEGIAPNFDDPINVAVGAPHNSLYDITAYSTPALGSLAFPANVTEASIGGTGLPGTGQRNLTVDIGPALLLYYAEYGNVSDFAIVLSGNLDQVDNANRFAETQPNFWNDANPRAARAIITFEMEDDRPNVGLNNVTIAAAPDATLANALDITLGGDVISNDRVEITFTSGTEYRVVNTTAAAVELGSVAVPVFPNNDVYDIRIRVLNAAGRLIATNLFEDVDLYTTRVVFVPNGGTPAPDAIEAFMQGDLVSEPAAMTREDYTFMGWYTDNLFVNSWNFADPVYWDDTTNGVLTLFARWQSDDGISDVTIIPFLEYFQRSDRDQDQDDPNHVFANQILVGKYNNMPNEGTFRFNFTDVQRAEIQAMIDDEIPVMFEAAGILAYTMTGIDHIFNAYVMPLVLHDSLPAQDQGFSFNQSRAAGLVRNPFEARGGYTPTYWLVNGEQPEPFGSVTFPASQHGQVVTISIELNDALEAWWIANPTVNDFAFVLAQTHLFYPVLIMEGNGNHNIRIRPNRNPTADPWLPMPSISYQLEDQRPTGYEVDINVVTGDPANTINIELDGTIMSSDRLLVDITSFGGTSQTLVVPVAGPTTVVTVPWLANNNDSYTVRVRMQSAGGRFMGDETFDDVVAYTSRVVFNTQAGFPAGETAPVIDPIIAQPQYELLLTNPGLPTADDGNLFVTGWYRDSSFTLPWNFATDELTAANTTNGVLTLYARWQSPVDGVSVYVEIEVDDGQGGTITEEVLATWYHVSAALAGAPGAPTEFIVYFDGADTATFEPIMALYGGNNVMMGTLTFDDNDVAVRGPNAVTLTIDPANFTGSLSWRGINASEARLMLWEDFSALAPIESVYII